VSVYSTRFAGLNLANGNNQLYTVPATQTVVVRDVWWDNATGSSATFILYVQESGSTIFVFARAEALAAGSTAHYEMRVVLNAGDVLWAYAPSTGATCVVSGYLLSP
jgi:hypothetical protein